MAFQIAVFCGAAYFMREAGSAALIMGFAAAVLATALMNGLVNLAAWAKRKSKPTSIEPILAEPLDNGVTPLSLDRGARLLKNIGRRRP